MSRPFSLFSATATRMATERGYRGLLGNSSEMQRLVQQIQRVAPTNVSVLIHGESGTGKELIARAIHLQSPRSQHPFVALNAAAIPEGLIESELFGHERGAYTGAVTRYTGKVQQANRGTLFLDEIGDLAPPSQAKLLRVIQERQFQRLGGAEMVECDFRLVTATHQNLDELIRAGKFREDLYFRLGVFEIDVPPLRHRKEDISILADQFISDFQGESNSSVKSISRRALGTLLAYDWPGNVRELQNAIQRALLLCDEEEIQPEHLPQKIGLQGGLWKLVPTKRESAKPFQPSAEKMEEIERRVLANAIDRCGGNLSLAIRELQIGRGRLYRKLRKYGLMKHVQQKRRHQ